jgi:hypothetical protein
MDEKQGRINYGYLQEMMNKNTAKELVLEGEKETERDPFCEGCIFGK